MADFERDALNKIHRLHRDSDHVVMVGGSGLFVRAVCEGLDEIPDVDRAVRGHLVSECREKGLAVLLEELKVADPVYYADVDKHNPQRVIRALEVIRGTGKPFSSFRNRQPKSRPFQIIKAGLNMDREALYDRIGQRMEHMLAAGLKEEAESLYAWRALNALQTVGYTEIFDYLDGRYDWDECVRLLKRNSRRYAKRQLTWFGRDPEVRWFNIDETGPEEVVRVLASGNERHPL